MNWTFGMNHVGAMRPWWDERTERFYIMKDGRAVEAPDPKPKLKITREDWVAFDATTVAAFRKYAPVTNYLMGRGLRLKLDGLETSYLKKEHREDTGGIDLPRMTPFALPLPVTSADYTWTNVQTYLPKAAKDLAEKVEATVVGTAEPYQVEGATPVYGLLSHPERTVVTAPADRSFKYRVIAMERELGVRGHAGPFLLMLGSGVWDDVSLPGSDCDDYARLLGEEWLAAALEVPSMGPRDMALVELSLLVVRVIDGLSPTPTYVIPPIQGPAGRQEDLFRILTITLPHVRNGSGVAVLKGV